MPAKRELTMRQLRQMLRLARDGVSAREIGRTLGVARSTVQDNLKRAAAAGLRWPLPGELTDGSRAAAVCASRRAAGAAPARRAGLGVAGARAEAARRQPDGAVGGVPGGPPGRLRLQPVLRPVPRVRAAAVAGACARTMSPATRCSSTTPARRSPIVDPAHRRGARGGDLRRRARRLELHLRRGDLDPDTAGLDRRARPHVPLLRRRAAPGRARQSEDRGPQGLVLRPRDQPQLRHDGLPLRRRRPAGPTAQAAATRPRSRPGSASPRPTSSAGCGARPSSRSPRPTRRSPAALERINDHVMRRLGVSRRATVRDHRAAGAGAAAGRRLRVRRVAPGPRRRSTITSRSRASSTRCRTA